MLYGIILAAGSSERFTGSEKKQFVKIKNKYVLNYSIEKFINTNKIDRLLIVLNYKDFTKDSLKCKEMFKNIENTQVFLIKGGKERYDSVYMALKFIDDFYGINKNDKVLIHDAARPNVNIEDINNLIKNLKIYNSITLGYPLSDSIKEISKTNNKNIFKISKTIKRDKHYLISTPQGFNLKLLYNCYNKFYNTKNYKKLKITDDTQIVELFSNTKSYILNSSKLNIKITTQDDLNMVKYLL